MEFSCGRSIGPFGPKPACKSAEPAAAATACSSSSGYCQRRQHLVSIVSAGSETCALPCAQGPHRTLCERATFRLTLALHYLDAEPARAPVNTVTLSSAMPWRRWIVWVVGPSWQSWWTAMHGQAVAHHSVVCSGRAGGLVRHWAQPWAQPARDDQPTALMACCAGVDGIQPAIKLELKCEPGLV